MTDRPNIPIPDELWAVREEIKSLGEREAILKQLIITDPETRTGNRYIAEVKVTKRQTTDVKEMKALYPDIVEQFVFPLEVTSVVLQGISDDGEIVSVRKLKKAHASADSEAQA